MEQTVESALEELQEMFPEALRIYVSEDADYFDGVLTKEAFILITHETFRAPNLSQAMAHVHAWKESQQS